MSKRNRFRQHLLQLLRKKNNNVKKILFSDSENLLNNRTYCYTYEFKNLIKEEVYIGLLNYDTQSNNLTKILLTNYTYDNYGNITSINRKIKTNEYSSLPSEIIYTYNTSNVYLLKSYSVDDISYQFNYDLEGNLLNFKDLTLSYKYGKLVNIESINSNLQISYEYNSKGIRTKKVVNNLIYEYITFNDLILSEKISKKNSDNSIDQLNVINYLYDSNNSAIGFKLGDDSYYYVKNLIGEIIYIVDENSNIVGEYKYDAYGNILNLSSLSPIAKLNSIRYKGYYYDVETGLFWLSSRYYSPELCRFISPDSVDYLDPSSINGLNLYAYCNNDPINYADPSGHVAISIGLLLAIGGIVGAVIGAGASVAGQYLANGCSWENFSWGQLALDTVLGGVSGMLSMSPLGWGTMIAANAGIGFVGAVGGHLINGSDFSKLSTWVDIGLSTGLGALVGVVGGPGALNAGYLNGAKQTAGFIRAAGLYDDVLTKAVTGFYRTPGIASNALRLSGQNLVKQWNKMVVSQAGKALTKALAYGGTALLIGTAGKGWLYDWYNDYF